MDLDGVKQKEGVMYHKEGNGRQSKGKTEPGALLAGGSSGIPCISYSQRYLDGVVLR